MALGTPQIEAPAGPSWVKPLLCCAAMGFILREFQAHQQTGPAAVIGSLLLAATALCLVLRPRWATLPLLAAALVTAFLVPAGVSTVAVVAVAHTVVVLPQARRREAVAVAVLLLGCVTSMVYPPGSPQSWRPLEPATAAAFSLVPLALVAGLTRRAQRRRLITTDDELTRLEDSLGRVRERERSRLVDELHQTVSARLADVQALLATRPRDDAAPGRVALLERIDVATRAALVEMRLVMQVLVDSDGPQADQLARTDLERADTLRASIRAANQELAERGVAAHIPLPEGLHELELAADRTMARVVREAVVPLLRSTRRPDLALVSLVLGQQEAQVRVQLADPLLMRTEALDARLELLGGRVQRRATPTGGSQLLVRVPRGAGVLPEPSAERRPVPWTRVFQAVTLVALLLINLQPLTWSSRLDTVLVAVLVARNDAGLLATMVWLWSSALLGFSAPGGALAVATVVAVNRLDRRRAVSYVSAVGLAMAVSQVRSGSPGLLLDDLSLGVPAIALGLAIRRQQARGHSQRARRAELEERREAILGEVRQDLARDLHDVVAHQLSVVTLQVMGHRHSTDVAELDLVLDRIQDATDQARSELASLGRVVLTGEEVGHVMIPSQVAQRMADELGAAGHPVECRLEELDQLPISARRTLIRLLQEGTTNVLRHAALGSPVEISGTVVESEVHFRMANRHVDGARPPSPLSTGRGLRGLEDRMELMGGHCSAGVEQDQWVLRATIPLD